MKWVLTFVLMCSGYPGSVAGQDLAAPSIDNFFPRGARSGSTVEVRFEGTRLGTSLALHFSSPHLRAGTPTLDRDRAAVFQIEVDPAAPCGLAPFFLRTALGLSEVMVFDVGDLREVFEAEPNGDATSANCVDTEITVNGRMDGDDLDVFHVAIPAPGTYHFEIESVRLGGRPADLCLKLADVHGVAEADDSALGRMDPILTRSFDAPTVVELLVRRRHALRGGPDPYRLSIGRFPRPLAMMPSGLVAGRATHVKPLDGGVVELLTAPSSETGSWFYYPANEFGTAPSPVLFRVGELEPYVETANGWVDVSGTPVSSVDGFAQVPSRAALHGLLSSPRERDVVRVQVTKGQVLLVRVHARSIASPLDSAIEVRSSRGRVLVRNDDSSGPDSYVRFQAADDDLVQIEIRDMLGRGGPGYFYRLELGAPGDRAELNMVPPRGFNAYAVAVPAGGMAGTVLRLRGLRPDPATRLHFDGLPLGVQAECGPWSDNNPLIPVLFRADANLEPGGAFVTPRLIRSDGKSVLKLEYPAKLVEVENRRVYAAIDLDVLPLAVVRPAPAKVRVIEPAVPIVRASPLDLEIHVERAQNFKSACTARLLWTPPGISAGSLRIDPDKSSGKLVVNAEDNATPGTYRVAVTLVADGAGAAPVVSEFFTLRVVEPDFTVTLRKGRAEAGSRGVLPLEIRTKTPLTGEFTVEILNFPRGVEAAPTKFTGESANLLLDVGVAPDAVLGLTKSLLLRLTVSTPQGAIRQHFRGGEWRVDAPLGDRPEFPSSRPNETGTLAHPKT